MYSFEMEEVFDPIAHEKQYLGGFESSWRMREFTDEKGIPFWEINREGETIEI